MIIKKGTAFRFLLALLVSLIPSAARAQVRPATITSVLPIGVQRGTTITLTVDGANLAGASGVHFSHSGLKGQIENVIDLPYQPVSRPRGSTAAPIEDLFALHRVLVKVRVDESTPAGRHNFRIQTPLGSTNIGSLYVGSFVEISEAEPNNMSTEAHPVFFPSTLVGSISRSGDEDYFEFEAEAGKAFVFEIQASVLGSGLDSELALLDREGRVLLRSNDYNGRPDSFLAHTFTAPGTYRIRVTDALGGGSGRHFYRLNGGVLPYLSDVFPLGLRKGTVASLRVEGTNLGGMESVQAQAPADPLSTGSILIQPVIRGRETLNRVRVAIGEHPEIAEKEKNDSPATAQPLTLPICVNGRIDGAEGTPDQDVFRFTARKGQPVSLTVLSQRLGSPLDSVVEVIDGSGKTLPRLVARPVWQTFVTLNDPDSVRRGMRIDSWSALSIGDHVMVGNEILQVEELPKNPDDDIKFRSFRGSRLAYGGTTPEAHSMNTPVYKVELHKPGSTFPPNGMPLMQVGYVNDDGGQNLGKDSFLMFEPPADGEYLVRVRDIRGAQGKAYAYRLTLAEPKPDFTLTSDPRNLNVPQGDSVPVTVTATRLDGFDGAIEVELLDLPAGITSAPGRILPGAASTTVMLRAAPEAGTPGGLAGFRLVGRAMIQGRLVERLGDNSSAQDESVAGISLSRPSELLISTVTPREVILAPGEKASITVSIQRRNGFAGRVPVDIRSLPLGVFVPDVGLNGILINETESERTFHIEVDPRTAPLEQTLYLVARIETNSPNSTDHASVPIRLKVVAKHQVSQK